MNIVSAGKDKYVYGEMTSRNLALKMWQVGEKPQSIYTFPDLKEKFKSSSVYLGFITANPKREKLVYAYQYLR